MLKNIATARSECTTKHENKASYSTNYNVYDLIIFFDDSRREIKPNSLLSELFSYKIIKHSLIKHIFRTEATSLSLF